jgi:hypothetical protein
VQTDIVVSGYPGLDPLCLSVTLISVQTSRVQLIIGVLGDPNVMITEFGTLYKPWSVTMPPRSVLDSCTYLISDGVGMSEHELRWLGDKLVTDRTPRNRVDLARIDAKMKGV